MNKSSFPITIIGFLGCVQLSVNGFNVTISQTSYDVVKLTCTVQDESGVIGFQWRMNGTLVASFRSDTCAPVGAVIFNKVIPTCESVKRMTLTLESSNMQYSQNWSCQVIQNKTQNGEYSSTVVQLKVSPRPAPKASTERTFSIHKNENFDLKIEVLSNPEPVFTWTRRLTDEQDWTPFTCTPHIRTESDGLQSTLKIFRAQSTDEGTYKVHVDNAVGEALVQEFQLFVTDRLPGDANVNGFNVTISQTSYDVIKLTCTVQDESGVIGFQWRMNGTLVASFRSDTCAPVGAAIFNKVIPTCESVKRMTLTLLESTNMQYSQNWSCQVIQNKTQNGEYSSTVVQLKVSPRPAPKASTERTFSIHENKNFDLKIEVLSNPEPVFTWKRRRFDEQYWTPFTYTPHIRAESDGLQSTLKIFRAQSTDEGTYKVHVDNAVGEALVQEFQLFVTDRLPGDANEPDVRTIGLGAAVIILIVLVVVIVTYRRCQKKCETLAYTYASSEDQRNQYDVPQFDEPQSDERPRNYGYLTTVSNL